MKPYPSILAALSFCSLAVKGFLHHSLNFVVPWKNNKQKEYGVIDLTRCCHPTNKHDQYHGKPCSTLFYVKRSDERKNSDMIDKNDKDDLDAKMSSSFLNLNSSFPRQHLVDSFYFASQPQEPFKQETATHTVRDKLGILTQLTRPENVPGIILLHMVGVFLVLSHEHITAYWQMLLNEPMLWLTLASLILTSATSMVVNDYYDAKLGRDVLKQQKPLLDGRLLYETARSYLSYLYAVALMIATVLPGTPTRLLVLSGLLLTYSYTKHLKPITWWKNITCAVLIALAPLTSGMAALYLVENHHLMASTDSNTALVALHIGSLWRLVATLFFGFLSREMMMDCNDVEGDCQAGIYTVPVVHGSRHASKITFGCNMVMVLCAMAGPLLQIQHDTISWFDSFDSFPDIQEILWSDSTRRIALAGLGSGLALHNSWRVWQTEGRDKAIVDRAVDQGQYTLLLFLASFI